MIDWSGWLDVFARLALRFWRLCFFEKGENEVNNESYNFCFCEAPISWTVEQNLILSEYQGVCIFVVIAIILALIITGASFVLVTQLPEVEKLTPYECGFEAYEAPRVQFDIKFCVIAILLILFDVEMMYVFPWCISICKLPALGVWSMVDFLLELGFGYIYLSEKQALEW